MYIFFLSIDLAFLWRGKVDYSDSFDTEAWDWEKNISPETESDFSLTEQVHIYVCECSLSYN